MTISPHAVIESGAEIGAGARIGPFTVVHANVVLGEGATVGSHCVLGHPAPDGGASPLVVGAGAVIRTHTVLYEGSSFGPRLETGHSVTVREGLTAGENLRLGTLCDLEGDATIGDFVRCHSNVLIGKNTTIGDFVWVFPYTVFTNDPHPPSEVQLGVVVEDFAAIGTMTVLLPGVRVGRGSMVSAGSVVTRDVTPGDLFVGAPAKRVRAAAEMHRRDRPDLPAYPWRAHFHRGYPDAVVEGWQSELSESAAGNPAQIVGDVDAHGSPPMEPVPAEPGGGGPEVGVFRTDVAGVELHRFSPARDPRGSLFAVEVERLAPFVVRRFFAVFDVPSAEVRGEHAHYRCHQFLTCLRGSLHVIADDGSTRQEFVLEAMRTGLYLPPMTWSIQYRYSPSTILGVLASDPYDPVDYIRDYDDFIRAKEARGQGSYSNGS